MFDGLLSFVTFSLGVVCAVPLRTSAVLHLESMCPSTAAAGMTRQPSVGSPTSMRVPLCGSAIPRPCPSCVSPDVA